MKRERAALYCPQQEERGKERRGEMGKAESGEARKKRKKRIEDRSNGKS